MEGMHLLSPIRAGIAVAGLVSCCLSGMNAGTPVFHRQQLSNQFWAEGANAGDFNRDGKPDIVSGPFWWEGPDYSRRHVYGAANETFTVKRADGTEETIPGFEGALGKNNTYSKNFVAYGHDINRDGWDDILILGFPGEKSSWYENPKGAAVLWTEHVAIDVTDNESPSFVDITGDGQPEIVCASKGTYGYAGPNPKDPAKPWVWHPVTPNNNYHKFTHGLGIGDINGDRRADLMEKDGWWEQPASLSGDPVWAFHKWPFGVGGSQMHAYDVNGDGLNDIITAMAAHGYGLAWFEQMRNGGEITFREHVFMNKEPGENRHGVKFSQLHAVELVDVDGDGLKDIVTGKRFWAHGPAGDPEPGAAPVLYWWQLVRNADKSVDWVPHLVDDNSGVGTQVVARDLNGDRRPDIIVGNKRGVFVFTQQ